MPAPRRPSPAGPRHQRGFNYIGVLILLAILGAASARTLEFASTVARRSAEAELQALGDEFSRAFRSYHEKSPQGAPAWPRGLDDLLRDPRFPGTVRHLRRVPRNPVSGAAHWGLIPAPGGGLMGVYAIAPGEPMRLPLRTLPAPAGVSGYAAWRFGYDPSQKAPPDPATPPAASGPAPLR